MQTSVCESIMTLPKLDSIQTRSPGLGEQDQAFEWFNKTFEENPYRISFIKVNPRFYSLRSHPRFTDLVRRMKLAP
jgi:hypothetical protein